ncbi:MAG TPA: peptidase C45, partial [Planctomycetaceae bacterium]|nr:peptidase C45 [Planctomycetaceae bacterium]
MVVSGKATADGRPLLWKNRDSWQPQNEVVYFDEGGLEFLAVVNADANLSVWMGVNSAG